MSMALMDSGLKRVIRSKIQPLSLRRLSWGLFSDERHAKRGEEEALAVRHQFSKFYSHGSKYNKKGAEGKGPPTVRQRGIASEAKEVINEALRQDPCQNPLLQRRGFQIQNIKKVAEGSPFLPEYEASVPRTSREPAAGTSKPIKGSYKTSVDPSETAKFAALAETWWDHQGPHRALHAMNSVRLSFIRAALCRHFGKDPATAKPLEGLRILDVGCGGGLACEPLARMGARVTGIDAVEKNISVAAVHAAKDPATVSTEYRHITAEQLVQEKESFDVVVALEIIEHVVDPKQFCNSLAALTKKDGMVVVSTINRSIRAYGLAILAVEYVLGWVPRGTHDWSKFVTPEELALLMTESSLSMEEMAGMIFNPITRTWFLSDDTNVNYIGYGIKRSQHQRMRNT